ncbi:MAG: hypothetical protein HOE73_05755 [Bacteroidetes Order II. Incertae sedis bacterium]|jgi:uncharacterized protein YbjT (DUF2867 family)|nr:hypothetical protein [Bacteroidetes Order II. bacterium]MBT5250844.1 hypothetical protein [Bacteroidetes Order II. bacterium]MBT6199645.1 hypothetical protein [Bacteroidetes Order II. bacterium]MBT6425161.1 hypothetical protein [Bacteroidetes Order II. bacterium]
MKPYFRKVHLLKNAMNALILGASGLVGGHCLDSILASPDYQNVIALTRRPLNRSSDKLIEQGFDGSDFSAFEPPVSIDHAFCAFGTTIKKAGSQHNMREIDVNIPFRLAQRLKALGVSHFSLVSSLGADYESNVFYNRIKGELEEDLKRLRFDSLAIFRPSIIGGNRPGDSRTGEGWGQKIMAVLPKRWKTIPAEHIANAMVVRALEGFKGTATISSGKIWDLSTI